mgnify:FL=1
MFEFASSGTGPADVTTPAASSEPVGTDHGDDVSDAEQDGEGRVEEVLSDDDDEISEEGDEREETPEDDDDEVTPDPKDPKAAKKAAIEKRIREMAAKKGLDVSDPVIYDLLRENAIMEQRREDSAALANKLKQEIDWETPWEKEQRAKKQAPAAEAEPKPVEQPKRVTLPTPQSSQPELPAYRPYVRVDQATGAQAVYFGDGFDEKWQKPGDAYNQLSGAWQKISELEQQGVPEEALQPLFQQVDNVQRAITRRHMLEAFPHIHQMIRAELAQFRDAELGDVIPAVRGSLKQNSSEKVYEAAAKDILSSKQLAPLFEEINAKPEDGSMVKVNGQQVPATPLNRYLSKQPELVEQLQELESNPNTPQDVLRRAIVRTWKLAMRQAHESKQGVEQTKQLVKQATVAGVEQAKRSAEKTAVRQATKAADSTPSPTRRGRSLLNPNGPGLSVNSLVLE